MLERAVREDHIWNQYVGFDFFPSSLPLFLPPCLFPSHCCERGRGRPWRIGSSGTGPLADRDRGQPKAGTPCWRQRRESGGRVNTENREDREPRKRRGVAGCALGIGCGGFLGDKQ